MTLKVSSCRASCLAARQLDIR